MATRPKTIRPVQPNAGLEQLYRQRLDRLIDDMHASLMYWIRAAYRAKPPETVAVMAQDLNAFEGLSPAMAMRKAMRALSRRWLKQFDEAAPQLAAWFATAAADRCDKQLAKILRDGGFSVRFKMSKAANDVIQATTGENVALIKSIATEHLAAVEGIVLRSVARGRDLHLAASEIEAKFGVTKRRAAFIAQSQNNMATANITRVRQQAIGVKQAIWVHSHAGAKPRPSHVKAGAEKVIYDVATGWFDPDEQKFILPGELPRCRCVSRPIIPGWD